MSKTGSRLTKPSAATSENSSRPAPSKNCAAGKLLLNLPSSAATRCSKLFIWKKSGLQRSNSFFPGFLKHQKKAARERCLFSYLFSVKMVFTSPTSSSSPPPRSVLLGKNTSRRAGSTGRNAPGASLPGNCLRLFSSGPGPARPSGG